MVESITFKGYRINVSRHLKEILSLRHVYTNAAKIMQEEFNTTYSREWTSLDALVANANETANMYFSNCVNKAIKDLIVNEIYDVDFELFCSEYYSKYYNYADIYNKYVYEPYMSIVCAEQEKDEYRTARRKNRGKWIGGGFGIIGALGGAMNAAVLNGVTGAAHGTFNLMAKGVSSVGAELKKDEIFSNEELKKRLVDGIGENVMGVFLAYNDVLNKYKKSNTLKNNDEELKKIDRMLNNIEMIPKENAEIVAEMLSIDPFNVNVYNYVKNSGMDAENEIDVIAEFFGVLV